MDFTKNKLDILRGKLKLIKVPPKVVFIVAGITSTVWFLIRVIPKPSRAGYPCMRAAAPVMSGFVIWLLSLTGLVVAFKKGIRAIKENRYLAALTFVGTAIFLFIIFNINDARKTYARSLLINTELPDLPNSPMGKSYGIFPGRVVWAYNPSATIDTCTNTLTDAYYLARNNNQDTINKMADEAVKSLSGKTTVKEAWNAIIKDFNKRKTGKAKGYATGQAIFFKINNGQAGWAIDMRTLAESRTRVPISGTTPSTVLAFVRQLVDSCNIPQDKIIIGEPMTHVYKHTYDVIHSKYPNVIIIDKEDHTVLGRTTSAGWTDNDVIFYSDKGKVMPDGISDKLMKEMYNADYLINIAALKAHARAGITLCAKNHLGSHGLHGKYGWGTFYLHTGLVATKDNDDLSNTAATQYGYYRVCVDMMGHKKLGLNTVLFVVDGLWGGIEAVDEAVRWNSAPFNNSWPNSIFIAQDQVAIESVCFDFLRTEAKVNTRMKNRPLFPAVDDYLHQAADKSNWPNGIIYDPENDGIPISSLGVHEHWNNPDDKQYSKNISSSGKGIELVSIPAGLVKRNGKKLQNKN